MLVRYFFEHNADQWIRKSTAKIIIFGNSSMCSLKTESSISPTWAMEVTVRYKQDYQANQIIPLVF